MAGGLPHPILLVDEAAKNVGLYKLNDVFHAQGLMFLGLAVLMWIIKKPPMGANLQSTH